jgi:hypothetical protein
MWSQARQKEKMMTPFEEALDPLEELQKAIRDRQAKFKGWDKFWFKLGFHVHIKDLYLVGPYAFVKCMDCGGESLPWQVPLDKAEASRQYHAKDVETIMAIDKRVKTT